MKAYNDAIKMLTLRKNSSNANFVGKKRRHINTATSPLMVTQSIRNTRMSQTNPLGKDEILSKQYSMNTTAFGSNAGARPLNGQKQRVKSGIDSKLFLYQTPAYQWVPSSVYRYDDFRESLSVMAEEGVAGKKFYIGEDVENGHVYGLVNIAAFLAQVSRFHAIEKTLLSRTDLIITYAHFFQNYCAVYERNDTVRCM